MTPEDPKVRHGRTSTIADETGCMSINPDEAHRLIRCNHSFRLSSDVIDPGEDRKLSLDVIIPDVILC